MSEQTQGHNRDAFSRIISTLEASGRPVCLLYFNIKLLPGKYLENFGNFFRRFVHNVPTVIAKNFNASNYAAR